MNWVQIKGAVKSLEGSWEFVELAVERTRATFALDIDPGRMLGMLLRGPVQGKVKEFLTKGAAEGLKQHVESDDSA
jgi:ribosome-associated toxin RatA of RatAB toxin-antitoxin module